MSDSNRLIFTMLGPRGSGKTSMLACMNRLFEDLLPGSFYPSDRKTYASLEDAYEILETEANSSKRQYNVKVLAGDREIKRFDFTIKGKKDSIPVTFYDFPGGFIGRNANEEDYNEVVNIVKRSAAVIVAIDTPYIMENDGEYIKYAAIRDIEQMLKKGLEDDKQEKLILLVPIKCEKYTETWDGRQALKVAVKHAFERTLLMAESEQYKGRVAIAMLPIHTIGNVKFSRFNFFDGDKMEQVFMKKAGQRFKPEHTDQPLRYALSFLLEQFKKKREGGSWWEQLFDWLMNLFTPDNIPEISNYVRKGIKTTDDRFEIICGRKLLGL